MERNDLDKAKRLMAERDSQGGDWPKPLAECMDTYLGLADEVPGLVEEIEHLRAEVGRLSASFTDKVDAARSKLDKANKLMDQGLSNQLQAEVKSLQAVAQDAADHIQNPSEYVKHREFASRLRERLLKLVTRKPVRCQCGELDVAHGGCRNWRPQE